MSSRVRFWRWYRTMPILVMALITALSLGVVSMPSGMVRRFFFPVKHEGAIVASASRYEIDPLLVCAVIKCESNWDETATSDAGAVGLMQIMPSTSIELAEHGVVDAWSYDPNDLLNPDTNIEYGSAYLAQLSLQLGSLEEVIAAYNAGPGAVEGWLLGGATIEDAIAYPETALYLASVKETYKQYQQLYTETLSER